MSVVDERVTEEKIASKMRDIFGLLGIEQTEGNVNTPRRIAKMWNREVFSNRESNDNLNDLIDRLKKFDSEQYIGQLIVVKGIPFNSMCEHHWMPFFGTVTVGYVPNKYVIGLSKIPRIVKWFSKRPQLQERYTSDIMRFLFKYIKPLAVIVEVKATHTCVSSRGVELPCETVTLQEQFSDILSAEERESFERQFYRQKGE